MVHVARARNSIKGMALAAIMVASMAMEAQAQPTKVGVPANDFTLDNRDMVIRDGSGRVRVRIDAQSGDTIVSNSNGDPIIRLRADNRTMGLGGFGDDGDLVLVPSEGETHELGDASVHLNAEQGAAFLGGAGRHGQLILRNAGQAQTVSGNGGSADIVLGQNGAAGDVHVRTAQGQSTVHLNGAEGGISAGGNGVAGNVSVRTEQGQSTVRLNGAGGGISAGGNGVDGVVIVRRADGAAVLQLDGSTRTVTADNVQARDLRLSSGGGIRFADGTEQVTAIREGPQGPRGPEGPRGPRGEAGPPGGPAFVNCVSGSAQGPGFCGCGAGSLISRSTSSGFNAPCSVATDGSGASCGANSFVSGLLHNTGSCCVCR